VYRANALEKLGEMTGLLEKWFPGALVTAKESDVIAAAAGKKVGLALLIKWQRKLMLIR
jgi:hypothetical protein